MKSGLQVGLAMSYYSVMRVGWLWANEAPAAGRVIALERGRELDALEVVISTPFDLYNECESVVVGLQRPRRIP